MGVKSHGTRHQMSNAFIHSTDMVSARCGPCRKFFQVPAKTAQSSSLIYAPSSSFLLPPFFKHFFDFGKKNEIFTTVVIVILNKTWWSNDFDIKNLFRILVTLAMAQCYWTTHPCRGTPHHIMQWTGKEDQTMELNCRPMYMGVAWMTCLLGRMKREHCLIMNMAMEMAQIHSGALDWGTFTWPF